MAQRDPGRCRRGQRFKLLGRMNDHKTGWQQSVVHNDARARRLALDALKVGVCALPVIGIFRGEQIIQRSFYVGSDGNFLKSVNLDCKATTRQLKGLVD